ncbi:MAG: hypothetical protein ACTH1D_03140 [Mycobacteriaceae bacterium]|uniref:hypothetical protein n=1 Tax=Corynebacterium sp. TaxID=1720 RepID=UPI003F992375
MDYEVKPEHPDEQPSSEEAATTAHHESLLRAEAARAARSNRVLGSFVIAGLAVATIVGVVTWQTASTGSDSGQSSQVREATADTELAADEEPTPQPGRPTGTPERSGDVDNGADNWTDDGPADAGRQEPAPLTEDQYLPPNAWNGDQFITPGPAPEDSGEDTSGGFADPGDTDGNAGTGDTGDAGGATPPADGDTDGSTDEYPSLTDILPSLPDLPTLPDDEDGEDSQEPSEPDHSFDPSEPAEPTDPSEPTEPTDPSDPSEPSVPSDPADPSEPTEPADPSQPDEPSAPVDPADPADTDAPEQNPLDPIITDTTGPTPE